MAASPPPLPLRVTVPASTSNLGPGFDLLGVALSRRLTVEVRALAEPAATHRFASLTGEAERWPEADNLLLQAFDLARSGTPLPAGNAHAGLAFAVHSEIPLARGLGSSGAAVAAGLLLGDALAGASSPREELLRLGLSLEGHPDNLTPALFGGARMSVPRGTHTSSGAPHVLPVDVHPSIGWAVAWPDVEIPTEAARASLPKTVELADAIENPRRLALLLAGLADADAEKLADGIEDRIHVAHRLALVPGAHHVFDAARDAGAWAVTLSGSGSAHVALCPIDKRQAVADAMAASWTERTGAGTGAAVEIVVEAPVVETV